MKEYYQCTNNEGICLLANQMTQYNTIPLKQNNNITKNIIINNNITNNITNNLSMMEDVNTNDFYDERKNRLDSLSKNEIKLLYNRLIDTCIELLESIYKISSNSITTTSCSKTERLSFKIFIENTIRRERISIPIFISIMFYIQRLRYNIQKNPAILNNSELALYDRSDLRKIYLVATMLAFKFFNDRNIQTIVWVKYAEYSISELNKAERHFLQKIDYYLNITEKNYNCLLDEYIKKILSITKNDKRFKEDAMEITPNTPTTTNTMTSPTLPPPTPSDPTCTTSELISNTTTSTNPAYNYNTRNLISPNPLNDYTCINSNNNNNTNFINTNMNNNNINLKQQQQQQQQYYIINNANFTPDNTMDILPYTIINNQIIAATNNINTNRKIHLIARNNSSYQTFNSPPVHLENNFNNNNNNNNTSNFNNNINFNNNNNNNNYNNISNNNNNNNNNVLTTTTPQSVSMNISPPPLMMNHGGVGIESYSLAYCC